MAPALQHIHGAVRVIRVFLASPSDLGPERRAAREAVDEINRTVARPAGFQVDLVGWEDTLSSIGRPQQIINEELSTCDLFIGMLWERWGTAPDTTGKFSSGFEEEYTLAYQRQETSGSPFMRLFFKEVDASKLNDAGPELSRVLDFKKRCIDEKKILFQVFSGLDVFSRFVREGIADFILRLKSQESDAQEVSRSGDNTESSEESARPIVNSQSYSSEIALLASISYKLGSGELDPEITHVEVARLRNLAAVFASSSNDNTPVDAHDANIIYAARESLNLSGREISALADAGLESLDNENTPVFYWLANRLAATPEWLTYTTLAGPDERRVNAFRAMLLMDHAVLGEVVGFHRTNILENWFSATDPVKNAALRYLAVAGIPEDINAVATELDSGNSSTRKSAAGAMLSILQRMSTKQAASWLAKSKLVEFDEEILDSALEAFGQLDKDMLEVALGSPQTTVRLRAMHLLWERRALTDDTIAVLLDDSALDVRRRALEIHIKSGKTVSDEDAEKVLVRKKPRSLFSIGRGDETEGTEILAALKRQRRTEGPILDLVRDYETGAFISDDAYFALCTVQPHAYLTGLRQNFDNRFELFSARYSKLILDTYARLGGVERPTKFLSENEAFRRRLWMREAADIIVALSDPQDLSRIRPAIDDNAVDPRVGEIEYLGALGDIDDIPRINKIATDYRIHGLISTALTNQIPRQAAAAAMLRVSSGNVGTLLSANLSEQIIPALIVASTKAAFRRIAPSQIDGLLNHSSPAIRKAVVLKLLVVQPVGELRSLLKRYVGSDKHRFYNVIFWLDLAIALRASALRRIAHQELSRHP